MGKKFYLKKKKQTLPREKAKFISHNLLVAMIAITTEEKHTCEETRILWV